MPLHFDKAIRWEIIRPEVLAGYCQMLMGRQKVTRGVGSLKLDYLEVADSAEVCVRYVAVLRSTTCFRERQRVQKSARFIEFTQLPVAGRRHDED